MSKHLLWIDLETTGLDPERCGIIEIAAVLTTEDMAELDRYESLVDLRDRDRWEPYALGMHAKNGLVERWSDGDRVWSARVAHDLVEMLEAHEVDTPTLAGSSVHFDRRYIRRRMAKLDRVLHYRHLDVSAITKMMMTCGHEWPDIPDADHRAMSDIERSMAIYRHWRGVVSVEKGGD